jgi:competence ComEA-like helix-hairpin-helix protein
MNRLFTSIGIMSVSIVIAAASFCSVAAQNPPNKRDDAALPDGPGKAIIQKSCSACHTASVITTKPGHTDDEWADILNKMVGRGAVLSDEDGDTLMQYLSTNFGPNWKGVPSAPAATAGAAPSASAIAPPVEAQAASAAGTSNDLASVNVNKASAQELKGAFGLTADEAELIVRHREKYGNYKTWEDVSSVPGVTAEKIKKNQKRLAF